jgi:adenosylcobinamide kinase/adenosylcobinamide-phosphate guanylyltransferase
VAEHTLILGGARSGKSGEAERRARAHPGPVTYVATARAGDAEMAERIRHHRARRPEDWQTLESPEDLPTALSETSAENRLLLVDCLTLWLTGRLERDTDAALERQVEALAASLAGLPGPCLLVANEVGLGIVPDNPLARRFRDWAGWLNQRLAPQCSEVVLMAAGLPLWLKHPDNPER